MLFSSFLQDFRGFCTTVEFSLHERHGMWYGDGRDRCFLITNCCCGGWFMLLGCWRNCSLLGGCRSGCWRVWAAPAPIVGGAAFNRKFCFISLTNSSIAITSLFVCLLGILLELSFFLYFAILFFIFIFIFRLGTLAQFTCFSFLILIYSVSKFSRRRSFVVCLLLLFGVIYPGFLLWNTFLRKCLSLACLPYVSTKKNKSWLSTI